MEVTVRHHLNAPALGSLSCSYNVYYKYLRALAWPVGHAHNIKTMNDLPRSHGYGAQLPALALRTVCSA